MKKFLAAVLLVVLLVPSVAFAEGFGVYEWSATGTAMGDNFMFDEEDAAVLAYNPAGITHLKGKHLSFGATWFNPAIKCHFNNTPGGLNQKFGTTSHKNNSYDPVWAGSIFYTQQLSDKYWWGLGIFPRFGNGISFSSGWEGRYDTLFSKITGITIQPTIAYKPHDKWSLAAGIDINYVKLQMDKTLPVTHPTYGYLGDSFFSLEGSTTKVGWFVSAMYDFDKNNSAAITYRSKIKHNMDADVSTSDVAPYVSGTNTKAHGSVTLPESVALGFGHKFNDRTRIEFDATWTNWTSYDALNLTFDEPLFGMVSSSENPKDWNAVWRFGVGFQHRMNEKWTFLCGYNFDASPVPDKTFDFTVPTGDRHRGSFGFKYNINKDAAITLAYTAIWAGSRDALSKVESKDFTSAHVNDCLTQILSLGFSMKLK